MEKPCDEMMQIIEPVTDEINKFVNKIPYPDCEGGGGSGGGGTGGGTPVLSAQERLKAVIDGLPEC